jgi:Na+/proline symporter
LHLRSEKQKVILARLLVVVSALFTLLFALGSESIYQLVEVASSFGTAGILVITLVGLHSRFGGAQAAIMTLIVGLGLFPVLALIFKWPAPFLTTVLCCLLVYVLLSLRSKYTAN